MDRFGRLENGEFGIISRKDLESHPCSAEELGLSGTEHKFFPIVENQRTTL